MNFEMTSDNEQYYEKLLQKEMRASERIGSRIISNEYT